MRAAAARRRAGIVASALVLCALATACPSERRPVDPSAPPPAPEGSVRFGYPQEPATLDPLAPGGSSAAVRDVLRPVLPALFALDERLRPVPELAERWPSGSDIELDPFSVRLRLREARWSDGRAITADDVRFTWEQLREGPDKGRYRRLDDVEVLGPRELVLRFDAPIRRWWALFSIDDMVLPAHAYRPSWDAGPTVSGGPFRFDGWERGMRIQLRRNPSYWGERAQVEGIEVLFVPDDETRLELLRRGELDALFAEGDTNLGRRAAARGWRPTDDALDGDGGASGAWGSAWWELVFERRRRGREPLARGVSRVVDRSLVGEILEDSGQVMDGIPARFPRPGPGADGLPAVPGPWPGDPDEPGRAMQGVQPREIRLAYARNATAEALGRFIHFALRPAGVHVEALGIEPRAFEARWLTDGGADAYLLLRRGADAPDAAAYRASSLPPGAGDAEPALERAETARDPQRLRDGPVTGLDAAAWTDAQRVLVRLGAVTPLARVRSWIVARPGLAGARATGTAAGPLWNAAEWTVRRSA